MHTGTGGEVLMDEDCGDGEDPGYGSTLYGVPTAWLRGSYRLIEVYRSCGDRKGGEQNALARKTRFTLRISLVAD